MSYLTAVLLFTFITAIIAEGQFLEQVINHSKNVIHSAAIEGITVRQCSCDEQETCSSEMKEQAKDCFHPCWSGFREITEHPDELKKCFVDKRQLLEVFLTCFEHNIDACVETKSGPLIEKTNITELFRLGEKAIAHRAEGLTNIIPGAVRKIVDTVANFGVCLKTCFLSKNENGFCFDRKNCQPLVIESKARKTIRRCTRAINFKKEAVELCECSVRAGLEELKDYCVMLKVMASRKKAPHG